MTRESFEGAMRDPTIKRILNELDIDEVDQQDLFDALDADGNDRLEIEELLQGVMKMRGKARKVDVVATRLMLKTLNRRIIKVDALIRSQFRLQLDHLEMLIGSLGLGGVANKVSPD